MMLANLSGTTASGFSGYLAATAATRERESDVVMLRISGGVSR